MNDVIVKANALKRDYTIRQGFFARSKLMALRGVSFTMTSGQTLACVGESGSGKSTLAHLITLLDTPSAGQLSIDGIDISAITKAQRRQLHKTVQMIFQNPYSALNPRHTIGQILQEPLKINTTLHHQARRDSVAQALHDVGLSTDAIRRYPHHFSGGQRQRIAIARALILKPKIIVADEPVSALDVSVQAQVLNLLKDCQDNYQLTYLFISHDLPVVRHFADTVMVMYLGRVVEHGQCAKLFQHPVHPYTQALLAASPSMRHASTTRHQALSGEIPSPLAPPTGCAFHPRCPLASDRCKTQEPMLREVVSRLVACHHGEQSAELAIKNRRDDASLD